MNNDTSSPLNEEAYAALAHPIRRRILELLVEEGETSYSRLVEVINIKSGPLYHHLKKLKPFVMKTKERKYRVTEEGKKAYSLFFQKEEPVMTFALPDVKLPENIGLFKFFTPLIRFFARNKYRTLVEFVIIALIVGYFASAINTLLLGNFVIISDRANVLFSYLSIFGSWLSMTFIAEVISVLLFKKKTDPIKISAALSLTFAFNFVFIILIWLVNFIATKQLTIDRSILLACYVIFQIWSFIIITSSLIELKELSLERAVIVSFIVNYLQIVVIIFSLI